MISRSDEAVSLQSSLQTRMIIYVVLLLSVLMVVTTYAGISRESQGIFDQMQKDGIALAKSYALSAENALLLRGAGLGRVTGEASRTRGIKYLKIVDRQRRIIGHTDVVQIGRTDRDPLYRRALRTPITAVEQGKKPITLISSQHGERIFRVIIPLVILDSVHGVLEVGLDMTGIAEAIRRTNNQSLLIAMAAFLCGGIFIWFFSRSLVSPLKELMGAAERVAHGNLNYEIRVSGKDEISHLAASFNYMTERLREYTGNLKRSNAQLEADAALIEKLRIYNENILNSITPGVLTVDLNGTVTSLNNAGFNVLPVEKDAAVGKKVGAVFPAAHSFREILEETLTFRKSIQGREIIINGPENREILLSVNTTFLYDQFGEVVGYAATFDDITQVKQLQWRIHESEKLAAMGELAVGIAHEVRNPLGAIKTSAQFLENKFAPADPKSRFPQLIIREVERLDQLVTRMLNFTRPAEQDFQYDDINEIIENVVTLASLKVNEQCLLIEKDYGANIPRLFVDAKRLSQAFLNILLNAIDAMPETGKLKVKTRFDQDKREIRIEFSDTGEGIPAEKLKRIFDPFFTTRTRGTGLGLAIVQQIIREHNGTIAVDSIVATGTVFTITLPLPEELCRMKRADETEQLEHGREKQCAAT